MRALLILAAFVGIPLLEIYLLIQVGSVIGLWWTVGLLLGISVAGTFLVRHQGRRAWRELLGAVQKGRIPDREVIDAGLVLVGGVLLVTPGFVTDLAGLALLVPFTRPLARGAVRWAVGRRIARQMTVFGGRSGPSGPGGPSRTGGPTGSPGDGPVIEGEVVEDNGR